LYGLIKTRGGKEEVREALGLYFFLSEPANLFMHLSYISISIDSSSPPQWEGEGGKGAPKKINAGQLLFIKDLSPRVQLDSMLLYGARF
jgi:hypothetical protein